MYDTDAIPGLDPCHALKDLEVSRGRLFLQQLAAVRELAGASRERDSYPIFTSSNSSRSNSTSEPRPGNATVTVIDAIRDHIAASMMWSAQFTQNRIDQARLLGGPLARTAAALQEGKLSVEHAIAMCVAAERLSNAWSTDPDEQQVFHSDCEELQDRVLPTAMSNSVSRTKKRAELALEAIDAAGQRERRRNRRRDSDVIVIDEGEGRAILLARLGIAQAHAALAAINAHAQSPQIHSLSDSDATPLSVGSARVAALINLLLPSVPNDSASTGPRVTPKANLDIVIDVKTLMGLREGLGLVSTGVRAPSLVAGSDIREILGCFSDISMRRLITDPLTGHLLDRGRKTYTPSAHMRAFITSRDITCRFPGCERSAKAGQIDHAREWNRGGESTVANLGALCIRHHQLKTHGGWKIITSRPDGSATWRAPGGQIFQRSETQQPHEGDAEPPDPPPF